jgi:hypothetical protein
MEHFDIAASMRETPGRRRSAGHPGSQQPRTEKDEQSQFALPAQSNLLLAAPASLRASRLFFLLFIFATALDFSCAALAETTLIRSLSGQFLVHDARGFGPSEAASRLATNAAFVVLDPTLLAVSAERVKQLLNRELGSGAPWRSRIHLTLYAAQGAESPANLTCESYRDGWQYFLHFPDVLERREYVRALVQSLLLEMATRNAGQRATELPTWLLEGLTEQLFTSSEMEIVLPPPRKSVNGLLVLFTGKNGLLPNPLQPARELLRANPMLTFEDLSWPSDDFLNGDSGNVYRRSAQLFVAELLKLKGGQTRMRVMLEQLPDYYNWQFAFFNAFSTLFQHPIDVEKWWSLHFVHFTEREVTQNWPVTESWQKLANALRPAVEVRAGTNDMPLRTDVPLQTIVREWDSPRQTQALKSELNDLEVLRYRLAPPLAGLADNYHQTIQTYLGSQNKSGGLLHRKKTNRKHALEEILKQLDALDAKRTALRPPDEPVAAQVSPNPELSKP